MKKLAFLLAVSLVLFSCKPVQNETEIKNVTPEASEVTDGVFIHLSHGPEDPHRVLMALRMAEIMSEDKNVLVYFDIKAVHVVLKNAENITMEGDFPNSHEQLTKLIENGVELHVCPGCLKAAGKSGEDIMDGIKLADKEAFFNFTEGKILSIDY
jgi:predicted peroxiredoxin